MGKRKTCKDCKKSLPTSDFYGHPNTRDRLQGDCKLCHRAKRKVFSRRPGGRYSHLKSEAKRRGIQCSLSLGEYRLLTHLGFCAYCSDPLPESGGGLDRCDSRLGYSVLNCVPCCSFCNSEKGRMDPREYTLIWKDREERLHFDTPRRWDSQSMLRYRNDQSGWRRRC